MTLLQNDTDGKPRRFAVESPVEMTLLQNTFSAIFTAPFVESPVEMTLLQNKALNLDFKH